MGKARDLLIDVSFFVAKYPQTCLPAVRHPRRLDTFAPSTQLLGISSLILPITRPRPPNIKVDSFADVIPVGSKEAAN